MTNNFSTVQFASYGLLRMPLALVELPLFLFLPTLYNGTYGVSLSLISLVLLLTRLVDAMADPFFGGVISARRQKTPYLYWLVCAAPVLALGFIVLLSPRPDSFPVWVSLVLGSVLTFAGYSIVSIAYQAWGADISRNDQEAAKFVGVREAFGLTGVILASALLRVETIFYLLILFVVLLVIALFALRYTPKPVLNDSSSEQLLSVLETNPKSLLTRIIDLRADSRFIRLLWVFLVNGIATAIPATLVLFFIGDVLGAKNQVPLFLLAYFAAGAIGMPGWLWACKRFGLEVTWLIGMLMAVFAFAWAVGLGAGDTAQFMAICVITGLALGADLAIPPAILAAVIKSAGKAQAEEASYFGVWNFATKFNLALAAAIALPLLDWSGYQPGNTKNTLSLTLIYAAVPCALKLIAAILLWLRPIHRLDLRT
jgi:glycoside/pentoside/hexuronide:cation symporter, GPH family